MSVPSIVHEVHGKGVRLVEVTGGEPLAQEDCHGLLTELCDSGFEVLLETSGAMDVISVDSRVRIIMDMKCPGSGMSDKMMFKNLERSGATPMEVKFVVGDNHDFKWAENLCRARIADSDNMELIVSPVFGRLKPQLLANWVMTSDVRFRLQVQLHKVIWPDHEGEI